MKGFRRVMSAVLMACMILSFSSSALAYSTVRMGSRGNDVKTLQTMLNTVEGTKLAVDGIFGNATKKAVINFQKKNKLTADGIAGAKTWAALEKQYNAVNNKKVPSTLKIGSGRYSPGNLTKGSVYSFSGTISSNYRIESVCVKIKNASGTIIQEKSASPQATSYDIHKLDNYIRFGTLLEGNYRFIVAARDASGKNVELVNNAFTVNAPPAPAGEEQLAKATFETQGKSMCLLTSISMLVKCKLSLQGKPYSGITQQTIKGWNGNVINADCNKIARNANAKSGVTGTLTHTGRGGKGGKSNKQFVIDLLKTRKEGVVAYFFYNGSNQHAVRICGYNPVTDTFYVSDPGGSNMAYVTMQKSRIGNKSYAWGSVDDSWNYLSRVIYYQ